ncbi:MAG: glycosyltransferase family 2 protein [Opitutales bacterium]
MSQVGVIMRTKDRPLLLRRALDSVLGQSFTGWQLVVVNDGGDPAHVDRLINERRPAFRGRVRVIHHATSVGMEAASNRGLAELSTRWAMIHDDDDSLHPGFMEAAVAYLTDPPHARVKGVITHTERVWEELTASGAEERKVEPYNTWLQDISLRRMLVENVFAPIAFVFDREACEEVGRFREDLPVLGDWDFNVRFLCHYEIGVVPRILARYHNRLQLSRSAYDSSVSGARDKHAWFDNFLRNEWLRADIAAGRTGVGVIANEVRMFGDLGWDLREALKSKTKAKWRLFRK